MSMQKIMLLANIAQAEKFEITPQFLQQTNNKTPKYANKIAQIHLHGSHDLLETT
jgi:hypothetical protein